MVIRSGGTVNPGNGLSTARHCVTPYDAYLKQKHVPFRRIVLARHGETEANRALRFGDSDDTPLTDAGREQSRALGIRIARRFKPDLLLSSPFRRARETSEILGEVLGLRPEILEGIHERHFGCLRGEPYERLGELMLADPAYRPEEHWLWCPPGGETADQVRARVLAAIEGLGSRPFREAVIVCHGAVIQAFCAHVTGDWRESAVPPNCGYVVAELSAQSWRLPSLPRD